MKSIPHTTVMHLTFWAILLLVLTACSGRVPAATLAPTSPATPTHITPSAPTEDLSGLSPEAMTTLTSLEKVDDYPLYVMVYSGGYDYPQTESSLPAGSDFSCSLFAAMGEPGDMLYGRNFDWDFSPALLLFTDPPDGYASVSMVDLTFLGFSPATARSLNDLPLEERTALLSAPSMPFDGMNEYGLTIAMAAVPEAYLDDASYDASKPTTGSIGIIREVLDHAKDVEEAVVLFEQYNIDFSGGPPIHYLIADPGGTAVLVEFYQGEMVSLLNEAPWHLATNHLRCIAEGNGGCERYRTMSDQLSASNGQLDPPAAMQLLSEVAQGMTQWSAVYDMTRGDISVVVGQSYETVYSFHLNQIRP
jgi:Acyl-coenzyme A:6-aminopenicillanic acid acyl-transferase